MFTGIIKNVGQIVSIHKEENNITFGVESEITDTLSIDQSVAHNGVCLTVIKIEGDVFYVTAILETIQLTTAQYWAIGHKVNLETAAKLNANLDGHIVQGHVDAMAQLISIEDEGGSFRCTFSFDESFAPLIIPKGSICIDGISLTVIQPTKTEFQVAIIPYSWENTIFHTYTIDQKVNIEFDLIGKYILRSQQLKQH